MGNCSKNLLFIFSAKNIEKGKANMPGNAYLVVE